MEIDPTDRTYFMQYELEYQIDEKRDSVKQADHCG